MSKFSFRRPSLVAWRSHAAALALTATVLSARAHPGHSLSEASPAHMVTSPYHLATLALAGLGMFAAARLVQRVWARRALQVGGGLAFAAVLVLWGLRS